MRRSTGLKELRRQAMLTQQELAERVGVHYRRIQEWESGAASPRPVNQRRLAEALGVTPRELLTALEEVEGKAAA